ncbi:hypothetical protein [Hyphomicrobium sp. MC1]|uniref:hypothetical protein n=1 Tax=Hyphomicrobium sp. (strain MC1) TaxID=717785 RepID=UPI000213E6AD|nr:hypothetical protein [Hyphomicrobium sp. MC1]CCB66540.1 conserved protein of unknown function [Hyphomicrobium sp. MC1]
MGATAPFQQTKDFGWVDPSMLLSKGQFMKIIFSLITAFVVAGTDLAVAQTTPPAALKMAAETAAPSSNLFTEEQARAHLAKSGYVDISPLTKNSNGDWRGTAVKDGKRVIVSVDVKANITTQ